jgi:hypothetical protein
MPIRPVSAVINYLQNTDETPYFRTRNREFRCNRYVKIYDLPNFTSFPEAKVSEYIREGVAGIPFGLE